MKLSIVTINYNNLEGLKRTYDSVVSQTCHDYEWIIIDGGSTDGSKEFIEEHQGKFAYWCSEPDKGVYNAMNKGIAKAKGEYLNFMNSGDCFYDEHTLEDVFSQKLLADLVYGDWVQVYNNEEKYISAPPKGFNATVYIENVCHQSMFVKSYILKQKGYDENMAILADWKRAMEMSLSGNTFQYIPYAISRIDAEDGLSRNETPQLKGEYAQLLDLMPDEISYRLKEWDEMRTELWHYKNNPVVSETARIAFQGASYKTKLIHLSLVTVKFLESIFERK